MPFNHSLSGGFHFPMAESGIYPTSGCFFFLSAKEEDRMKRGFLSRAKKLYGTIVFRNCIITSRRSLEHNTRGKMAAGVRPLPRVWPDSGVSG